MLVVTANKDFHVFNAIIFFNNFFFLSVIICLKVGVFFSDAIFLVVFSFKVVLFASMGMICFSVGVFSSGILFI
jgi:hypothetical protein